VVDRTRETIRILTPSMRYSGASGGQRVILRAAQGPCWTVREFSVRPWGTQPGCRKAFVHPTAELDPEARKSWIGPVPSKTVELSPVRCRRGPAAIEAAAGNLHQLALMGRQGIPAYVGSDADL